jgi:hypothetical protein
MKSQLIISVVFLINISVFAQDPGIPDSVIVNTVYADTGQPYVDVAIFAVTDEDVCFYNIPVTWSIEAGGIEPTEVFYYNMLVHWDFTFDSVLVAEHFLRMVGWADLYEFYLNTGGYRLRCWSIRFTIDSLAQPQVVTIDTTYDPINGSLIFGLVGGTDQWTPNFIPGVIYYGVTSETGDDSRTLPGRFSLPQNYPNPFNASTTIEFALPEAADAELSVYNILGQKVAVLMDGQMAAGDHTINWDAGKMPSGIYFARLETDSGIKSIKMLLLR